MPKTYARFAAAPIGAQLAARDSGLTLTTTAISTISRAARSDIGITAGTAGAEFVFWGDDVLSAVIGILSATASLGTYVGGDATGIGWRLATGEVVVGGAVVASGLPAVAKGDTVGVRVTVGSPNTVKFYKSNAEVHSRTVAIAGTLHFGASLASTTVGGLTCAVNAGQWGFASAAALADWVAQPAAAASARLADEDYLSATTDAPANASFLGVIGDGMQLVSEIWFWPWGGQQPTQGGAAQCTVTDAGALDALALTDVSGTPVAIRTTPQGGTLAAADAVARFALDRVEIMDDGHKTVYLRDAHDDLDDPLTRKVFLPNLPALAWQIQPVLIGAMASVPAAPVNSDGTVLWLSDAALDAVSVVMDRGDAMEAGTYTLTPDGQQLTTVSPPVGPVVCDVATPAPLQQLLAGIFGRIGKSSWVATDAAAIDAATGYAGGGYYAGELTTVRQALAAILPSWGAWHRQNADGTLGFVRVTAPEAWGGVLAFDLDGVMLAADITVLPDTAPNLSRRMAYRPNARPLGASDLVTDVVDVPQSLRDQLTGAFRGQVYGGGTLAGAYRHADSAEPFVSRFWAAADAQSELDRVIGLYSVPRRFYAVRYRIAGDEPPPLVGTIGRLSYDHYGLDAGKQLLVRRVTYSPSTGDTELILWG